jgi:hypothetical protein
MRSRQRGAAGAGEIRGTGIWFIAANAEVPRKVDTHITTGADIAGPQRQVFVAI